MDVRCPGDGGQGEDYVTESEKVVESIFSIAKKRSIIERQSLFRSRLHY